MKKTKQVILSTVIAGLLLSGGTYAEAKKPADKTLNLPHVMQQTVEKKQFEKELLKFKAEVEKLKREKEKNLEETEELKTEFDEDSEELAEELKELEEESQEEGSKQEEDLKKKIEEKREELQKKQAEKEKKFKEKTEEKREKFKEKAEKMKGKKFEKLKKVYKVMMKNGVLSLDLDEELEIEEELQEMTNIQDTVIEAVYEDVQKKQKGLRKLVERLKDKTDSKSLTKLALIHKNLGEYDTSLSIAKNILQTDPTNKKALILSAQVLRDTGRYDAAQELIDALSITYPELDLTAFKAILKEDQGDLDGAAEALEEAIQNNPTEKDLYKKIGLLYNQLQRKNLKIFIDGMIPEMDVEPTIESGRTLVPIRAVAETMGAEVSYDKEKRMAIVEKDDVTIELPLGFNQAKVNGEVVELDVPSMVINNRLLIPLRFVAETLDAEVSYDGETKLITIIDGDTLEDATTTETETTNE